MPPSHAATTKPPIHGAARTSRPAAISTTPTKYMKSCALPGTMSSIQGARYCVQSTVQLKNLSSPNRIGATTKPMRSNMNTW